MSASAAASPPSISMGLAGLTAAGAARGLALRWITAPSICRHFTPDQVRGIQPFRRRAPENGVAERFNRTLKERIHGRIYRNIAELRDAVRDFVELYNAQWIVAAT